LVCTCDRSPHRNARWRNAALAARFCTPEMTSQAGRPIRAGFPDHANDVIGRIFDPQLRGYHYQNFSSPDAPPGRHRRARRPEGFWTEANRPRADVDFAISQIIGPCHARLYPPALPNCRRPPAQRRRLAARAQMKRVSVPGHQGWQQRSPLLEKWRRIQRPSARHAFAKPARTRSNPRR
jgi:hypothetical protein